MCPSVDETVDNYEASSDFVKVDVAVKGQDDRQPHFSKLGDAMPQHDYENKH